MRNEESPRLGGVGGLVWDIDPAASYSPTREPGSTIGAEGLNFRVRDGNGCDPLAIATGNWVSVWVGTEQEEAGAVAGSVSVPRLVVTPPLVVVVFWPRFDGFGESEELM